jgi:hypothetical protein
MTLAAAEHLASCARKQGRSFRLGDRLAALAAKRRLVEAGYVALAQTILV